jgi:serine/threonine-protein kinase
LTEVLGGTETFDQDRTINIATQIAAGVNATHEKNSIHGRLTPDNVFVRRDEFERDVVKVFGFGSDPTLTPRGADPRYLAPEQLEGPPTADARTDVYALGMLLYRMLSGVLPFDAPDGPAVLKKIHGAPPAPLSAFRQDLHPEIEPIILTALAADPERRYQTVAAFAEDLALASGQPVLAKPAAVVERNRNPWKAAILVAAGVIILAGVLIYATSVKKTDITAQLQAEPGMLPVQPIGPATGAQEESLSKMPDLTPEDVAAMQAGTMAVPPGTLPGGDGYNAWSNGGAPPLGAPPATSGSAAPVYVAPPGQTVTIDPNGGSQFMPQSEGVILVPIPVANSNSSPRPTPTPKPAGNTAAPSATPKGMVSPTPKPATTQPKPAASPKKTGNLGDIE